MGEWSWPAVAAILAAVLAPVLGACGVLGAATLQRRGVQDQNTTNLRVHADNAQVDAAKLILSDKELEVRKEVWASEMAERIGSAAHTLLTDAEARIATALAEVATYRAELDTLKTTVGALTTAVADCERRCAAHEQRSAILLTWARAHGWVES